MFEDFLWMQLVFIILITLSNEINWLENKWLDFDILEYVILWDLYNICIFNSDYYIYIIYKDIQNLLILVVAY